MQKPPDTYPPGGPALEDFWAAQPSAIIREMLRTAAQFALSDLGVRIVGEAGSGKANLARLIHRESPRCTAPFRRIDCSALSPGHHEELIFGAEQSDGRRGEATPGILETSRGATVYFDGFEHLSAPVQQRLFRAMELRQFRRVGGSDDVHLDVRIITGMTKAPGPNGSSGDHADIQPARPGPVIINIPPLRERREDIGSLIYLFLRENRRDTALSVTQITAEALESCRNYGWPGNIYELRNVIRHSLALAEGGTLKSGDLPEYIRKEEPVVIQTAQTGAGGRP